MTEEDFATRGVFFCKDAGERFLGENSVDLFIGHPPYYQAELEMNGGDPKKQMQNTHTLEEYWDRLILSVSHMEYALNPEGHIFIALQNTQLGLGILGRIEKETSLELQNFRMWDYSVDQDNFGNHTVLFAHYRKQTWGPGSEPQGPFILTNSWSEAYAELEPYHNDYRTVGSAPKAVYTELIKNFSKEGEVVCDLFAGSGTVPLVAAELGRKFVFNDVSEDKVIVGKKRIKDYLLGSH
jgi:DNA modification methylase